MIQELIIKRNTYTEIDLNAIKSNYQFACSCAPNAKSIAVIKANAYGHGLVEVAKSLEDDVPAFAVAIMSEAIELREAGIAKPILILQGAQTEDELRLAGRNNFWLCVYSEHQVELVRTTSISNPVTLWFKLDSGLHRLGMSFDLLSQSLKSIEGCPWINETRVIYTHFSCSDEMKNDESDLQMEEFYSQAKNIEVEEGTKLEYSLANSSAIVRLENSHKQWNRPGIMLYGMNLFDENHSSKQKLTPAMSFYSTVIGIREIAIGESVGYGKKWTAERPSKIATLSVGYADGYPRHAKNGTPVLINGHRVKLVGRVSMDLISIDVTELSNVKIGDRAELWGRNIDASEVAECAETISYDLLTGISQRVPRVYI
ncbi:MAG: alanine racemase [Gammaproteobacteria bacterium]|nr:MAG: alanine racemase [Gammaproteobacteria bacterium]